MLIIIVIVAVLFLPTLILRYSFESNYKELMNRLDNSSMQEILRANMTYAYNFTDLLQWEHKYVKWVPVSESFERFDDPVKILKNGKGRCGEFSILYVAACLSLGYETRLMAAVNPHNFSVYHNWAEVKYEGRWIQVDPTDQVWDNNTYYSSWWGEIGKDVLIFAIDKDAVVDVTAFYL